MRPQDFADFVGQDESLPWIALATGHRDRYGIIRYPLGAARDRKNDAGQIIARHTKAGFILFSAVTSGIADLREIIKSAERRYAPYHQRTILFVDEIHRFNKAQQDAFLPHVEQGTIILHWSDDGKSVL